MSPSETEKIPVYFMPGMAAGPSIFNDISLPEDRFDIYFLEWFVPDKQSSLKEYAQKLCEKVDHQNPVLIGVSFGGFLVQEMARLMPVRKVIIISSVKRTSELPRRWHIARRTGIHRLIPTRLVNNVEFLSRYAFGDKVGSRLKLYRKYLAMRDKSYIDWCLHQIVNWRQNECDPGLVHIHGDKDAVFPIQYINDCITVKNGTHTMIIHRYKWFNERLPAIILEDRSCI